jgi:uncharacterized membrane protein required for colicin V production
MDFTAINYIAVVVGAVASFAFGSIYYMAAAKPWRSAIGKTEAQVKQNMTAMPFVVALVAQLVMAYVLAAVVASLGAVTPETGVYAGFLMWFGFVLTSMAVNHGFQGAKRSLTVIDGIHWLAVLLVQGLVIGLFGV